MAKKSAPAPHTEELPPAMDYAMHNSTYEGFIGLVKWGIVATAIVVLALYAYIEGHSPLIGTLLLLLIPVGAVGLVVMGSRRS